MQETEGLGPPGSSFEVIAVIPKQSPVLAS